jgi:hypothetical protein
VSEREDPREPTTEEAEKLYLFGFHEVQLGRWQLGSTDNPVKEEQVFTLDEALDYIKDYLE